MKTSLSTSTSISTSTSFLHLKQAFTLVELLVVIGIIGILAGVLFASFGGATENARAAQCMTNMKNLAAAVNAYAMQTGHYPIAGSREAVDVEVKDNKAATVYKPQYGWISWLDRGRYEDSDGNRVAQSHQKPEVCSCYGTDSTDDNTYAITNGAIWKFTGFNRKIYTCPAHVLRNKSRNVLWSYVMNSKFGYDYSQGAKAVTTGQVPGLWYGSLKRTDRLLLFSEMPSIDPSGVDEAGEESETLVDCTLQYKANVDGKNYKMDEWHGTAEVIGFPHRHGKRGRFGHVVFADGHAEKFLSNSKGLKLDVVTAILCEGLDVTFSPSKGYGLPNDANKMDD